MRNLILSKTHKYAPVLSRCVVAMAGIFVVLMITTATWAAGGDLGAAMDRMASTSKRSFGIIDFTIYLIGTVIFIGGILTLRNGRQSSNPGAVKAGAVAIMVGLAIIGWKGIASGFYTTVGIDQTGAGFKLPHMGDDF